VPRDAPGGGRGIGTGTVTVFEQQEKRGIALKKKNGPASGVREIRLTILKLPDLRGNDLRGGGKGGGSSRKETMIQEKGDKMTLVFGCGW